MADPIGAILGEVQSLPPTQNPYPVFANALTTLFYPPSPSSYMVNIVLLAALAIIMLLLVVGTAVGVYRAQRLWLFRVKRTARGTLIMPNSTALFTSWMLLLSPFLISVFWIEYARFQEGGYNLTPALFIVLGTAFFFLLMVLFCEVHGLAVAAWQAAPEGRLAWFGRTPPILLNIFFVLEVLAAVGLLAPLGYSQPSFIHATHMLEALENQIVAAGSAWIVGQRFNLDPSWLPSFGAAGEVFQESSDKIGGFFISLCTALGLVTVLFIGLSILHIYSSRYVVRAQRQRLHHGSVGGQTVKQLDHELAYTFRAVVAECAAISVCSLINLVVHIVFALHPLSSLQDGNEAATLFLLEYYAITLSLLPIAALVCWRVWRPLLKRSPIKLTGQSYIEGIKISRTVEQDIDDDAFDVGLKKLRSDLPRRHTQASFTGLATPALDDKGELEKAFTWTKAAELESLGA